MKKDIKIFIVAIALLIPVIYFEFEKIKDIIFHIWSLISPAATYFTHSSLPVKGLIIISLILIISAIKSSIKKGKIIYNDDTRSLKQNKKAKSFGFYTSKNSNRDVYDFIDSLVNYIKREKKKNTRTALILKNVSLKIIKPILKFFLLTIGILLFIAFIAVTLKDRI